MPIIEIGYRHWSGKLTNIFFRWLSITKTGIMLNLKIKTVRWLLTFAFAPVLYIGIIFYIVGFVIDKTREADPKTIEVTDTLLGFETGIQLSDVRKNPEKYKNAIWTEIFYVYMKNVQMWIILIIAGLVGTSLISQDIKSNAFLFYYSKPITLFEYFIGKMGVIIFFIAVVSLIPNIIIYILSISFSSTLATIEQTVDVFFRIFICFLATAIPVSLLVLFFSSLTKESRYAMISYYSFCFIGSIFYTILKGDKGENNWVVISIYDNLQVVLYEIFNVKGKVAVFGKNVFLEETTIPSDLSIFTILLLSALAFVITYRKISAPIRI